MSQNPHRRDFRHTKIVCTLGPASSSKEVLRQMADSGMNVARLNMSHGNHESHGRLIETIEELNREIEHPIALLLDTQGPEIRTGERTNPIHLEFGEEVTLTVDPKAHRAERTVMVNYANLVHDLRAGNCVTLDNGLINLEVLQIDGVNVRCRVLDGGELGSRRHVNLPGIHVDLPSITEQDERDIRFGLARGIDMVALSFVRHADDIRACRKLVDEAGQRVRIYAKIECQEGLENFNEILEQADGIMVARGDLGVEVELCELPVHQRMMIRKCIHHAKPVIVATHLLESMIENPTPTRAEVSDVANAVYEGADAIMLSGETSAGKRPARCVKMLDSIARRMEREPSIGFQVGRAARGAEEQLAKTACGLANSLGVRAIVVPNHSERLADALASFRSQRAIVFAFTKDEKLRRNWCGVRSVISLLADFDDGEAERTTLQALAQLQRHGHVSAGEAVVVLSQIRAETQGVEAVQVRVVESSV